MNCVICEKPKKIVSKGKCAACNMRERRAAQRHSAGKRLNGETLKYLMSLPDQTWREKIYERITPTTDKTACHEWSASKTKGGYGIVTILGVNILAHRAMHAFATGDADAEVVMHECDNPSCCNPRHLRSGTYRENAEDMMRKGRYRKGNSGKHLKAREIHPRAQPIMTPLGEFPSAALAAEKVGLHYKTILKLAKSGEKGFYWM